METSTEQLILVVDSNPTHVQVVEQVLAQEQARIVAIANGQQALDYLHQSQGSPYTNRPDLILLDVDLPACNGYDILAAIKTDEKLRRIPVIVITTSNNPSDVLRSYSLQGNCYVIKAMDLNQLAQTVKRIKDFWLEIVTLPIE